MTVIGQEYLPLNTADEIPLSDRVIQPELRQLQDDKMFSIIRFNLRNGKAAKANKKQQRKKYEKKIWDEEGREVRAYLHATPARRKVQRQQADKTYLAKIPVKEQSATRKARRHAAKARKEAAAAEALAARAFL